MLRGDPDSVLTAGAMPTLWLVRVTKAREQNGGQAVRVDLDRALASMSHHYSGPAPGFPHGDACLDLTDLYAFGQPGDDRKSILIMNVHLSFSLEPRGPTRSDPFAHEAIYELKIDTDGGSVADIAYRARFSPL